jgi:hypothetical protein
MVDGFSVSAIQCTTLPLLLYVELKHAMGIGPVPVCNNSPDRDPLVRIVRRVAVVRDERSGKDQSSSTESKNHPQFGFQWSPPSPARIGPAFIGLPVPAGKQAASKPEFPW